MKEAPIEEIERVCEQASFIYGFTREAITGIKVKKYYPYESKEWAGFIELEITTLKNTYLVSTRLSNTRVYKSSKLLI